MFMTEWFLIGLLKPSALALGFFLMLGVDMMLRSLRGYFIDLGGAN